MKINMIKYIMAVLILSLALPSCDPMDKTQKKWSDGPERIYVGKLDSLMVRSGIERVEIVGNTRYLRTATTCKVKYGDIEEVFQIEDIIGDDGYARMVIGAPEKGKPLAGGSYYFDVTTHDDYGNRSIVTSVYGEAYNPQDAEYLYPVKISSMKANGDGTLSIMWDANDATYWVLEYKDASDALKSLRVEESVLETKLDSWKPESEISVTSYVLKKETDIDVFVLDPVKEMTPAKP